MKTRFDSAKVWRTNNDTVVSIKELETSHLMNIVRMLLRRPETVQTMLVCDIERQSRNVWRANDLVDEDAIASIHNATSMTPHRGSPMGTGHPPYSPPSSLPLKGVGSTPPC